MRGSYGALIRPYPPLLCEKHLRKPVLCDTESQSEEELRSSPIHCLNDGWSFYLPAPLTHDSPLSAQTLSCPGLDVGAGATRCCCVLLALQLAHWLQWPGDAI